MQTNAVVKDIKLQSDTIKEFSQIVHNTLINFNGTFHKSSIRGTPTVETPHMSPEQWCMKLQRLDAR